MSFSNNYNYYKHKIKKKSFTLILKSFDCNAKYFVKKYTIIIIIILSEKLQYFQETKKQLPSGMYCLKSKKKNKQTIFYNYVL